MQKMFCRTFVHFLGTVLPLWRCSPPRSRAPKCSLISNVEFCSLALVIAVLTHGCATPLQNAGLAAGITAAGGRSPGHEIEQVYYLGVFDPQDQVSPAVYRVTVHGQ